MTAYQRGRLARRMGRLFLRSSEWSDVVGKDAALFKAGWCDEDDTLRTGVDSIQAAYVADRLAVRRAAEENRFRERVRSQRVAG